MPAPSCSVPYCTRRTDLHKFPKDPNRRRQWAIAIRREGFEPTNNSYVCRLHFTESDFGTPSREAVEQGKSRKKLKTTAVPTVFHWSTTGTLPVDQSASKAEGAHNASNGYDYSHREQEDKPLNLTKHDNEMTFPHTRTALTTERKVDMNTLTDRKAEMYYDSHYYYSKMMYESPYFPIENLGVHFLSQLF